MPNEKIRKIIDWLIEGLIVVTEAIARLEELGLSREHATRLAQEAVEG